MTKHWDSFLSHCITTISDLPSKISPTASHTSFAVFFDLTRLKMESGMVLVMHCLMVASATCHFSRQITYPCCLSVVSWDKASEGGVVLVVDDSIATVLEYRLASLATWCDQHHSLIYLCFKVILHVFKYIFLLRIPLDYHPPNRAPAA